MTELEKMVAGTSATMMKVHILENSKKDLVKCFMTRPQLERYREQGRGRPHIKFHVAREVPIDSAAAAAAFKEWTGRSAA